MPTSIITRILSPLSVKSDPTKSFHPPPPVHVAPFQKGRVQENIALTTVKLSLDASSPPEPPSHKLIRDMIESTYTAEPTSRFSDDTFDEHSIQRPRYSSISESVNIHDPYSPRGYILPIDVEPFIGNTEPFRGLACYRATVTPYSLIREGTCIDCDSYGWGSGPGGDMKLRVAISCWLRRNGGDYVEFSVRRGDGLCISEELERIIIIFESTDVDMKVLSDKDSTQSWRSWFRIRIRSIACLACGS